MTAGSSTTASSLRSSTSHYRRVLILDRAGVEKFAEVEIGFNRDQKIKKLKARTVKGDGTEIEVEGDDVHQKTVVKYASLRRRAKVFAFPNVEPGDIVEFRYVRLTEGDGAFLTAPTVQLRHDVLSREAMVRWIFKDRSKIPAKDKYFFQPAYTIANALQLEPVIDHDWSPAGVEFRFRDVPPFPNEPFRGGDVENGILFMAHYDFPNLDRPYWERVARHLGEDSRDFYKKSSELEEWMAEIIAQDRDFDRCVDKLRSAFNQMVDLDELDEDDEIELRKNVNDALDEAILHPYDVNRMLVAMMRRLGYEATVFHARDLSDGVFLQQWESFEQLDLNGVVLKRGDELVWCVPEYCRGDVGAIPWELATGVALLEDLSKDDESNPFPLTSQLPEASADDNVVELIARLRSDDGERLLRGTVDVVWDAPAETFYRGAMEWWDDQEVLEGLRERLRMHELSATIIDEDFALDDWRFSYSCSLEVRGGRRERRRAAARGSVAAAHRRLSVPRWQA